jgi:hypothetical protein
MPAAQTLLLHESLGAKLRALPATQRGDYAVLSCSFADLQRSLLQASHPRCSCSRRRTRAEPRIWRSAKLLMRQSHRVAMLLSIRGSNCSGETPAC